MRFKSQPARFPACLPPSAPRAHAQAVSESSIMQMPHADAAPAMGPDLQEIMVRNHRGVSSAWEGLPHATVPNMGSSVMPGLGTSLHICSAEAAEPPALSLQLPAWSPTIGHRQPAMSSPPHPQQSGLAGPALSSMTTMRAQPLSQSGSGTGLILPLPWHLAGQMFGTSHF